MTPARARRHFSEEIEQEIRTRVGFGDRRASDIAAALRRRFGASADLPDERTIRRRITEQVAAEGTELWSVEGAAPGDAALVLPVLAAQINLSEGKAKTLPKKRGDWIARIRRAAPTIPPWQALYLAIEYLRAEQQQEPERAQMCDAFLAYEPWQNDQTYRAYAEAAEKGWLPSNRRIIAVLDDEVEDGTSYWVISVSGPAKPGTFIELTQLYKDFSDADFQTAFELDKNIQRRAPYTKPKRRVIPENARPVEDADE